MNRFPANCPPLSCFRSSSRTGNHKRPRHWNSVARALQIPPEQRERLVQAHAFVQRARRRPLQSQSAVKHRVDGHQHNGENHHRQQQLDQRERPPWPGRPPGGQPDVPRHRPLRAAARLLLCRTKFHYCAACQRAQLHGIILSLHGIGHFHRHQGHGRIHHPPLGAQRPAVIPVQLRHHAALRGDQLVGLQHRFLQQPLGHAGRLALASGHRARPAGDAQALQRHRDDDGHEHQRRQHLRQREAGPAPVPVNAGWVRCALHNSSGCWRSSARATRRPGPSTGKFPG